MKSQDILQKIEILFDKKSEYLDIDQQILSEFFQGLENGSIRAAFKDINDQWTVDLRVKKGILLAFKNKVKRKDLCGILTFIDKEYLGPREFNIEDGVRIVAGGSSVRRGAYLGKNVTVMPPSFINIGSFIDDNSMIDSHALVGSCAQIGKNVHISAGVQIGGVLEPVGQMPVIIEDNVFIGGQCGIFEGAIIKKNCVIGAGVILTKSSKIYDLVNEKVIEASINNDYIQIPKNAVLVPGSRNIDSPFAKHFGLCISTPIIIKYRDEKTSKKTILEEALR